MTAEKEPQSEEASPKTEAPLPFSWHRVAQTPPELWEQEYADAKIPSGYFIIQVRCKMDMTGQPKLGDRILTLSALTAADERLAIGRSMGNPVRATIELTKQMIRVIDKHVANWDGRAVPGNVEQVWEEIGPRYRTLLTSIYNSMHSCTPEQVNDFLANCVRIRLSA